MSIFITQLQANKKINQSWNGFLNMKVVQNELTNIQKSIGNNFTPSSNLVLRFLQNDLNKVRVVIIGKDPYPQLGVATGRSFEVNFNTVKGKNDWNNTNINISLKNIIKLIHKSSNNKQKADTITVVRNDINNNNFNIPSPQKIFDYWEKQGVLFLNSAFTCEIGNSKQSGSHIVYWKAFTQELLNYIIKNGEKDIKFFLWGEYSKNHQNLLLSSGVNQNNIYASAHPSSRGNLAGYLRNSQFFMSPCFYDTNHSIINWNI